MPDDDELYAPLPRLWRPSFPAATRGGPARRLDLVELDYQLTKLRGRCVVIWTSARRFTYAAVYAGNTWYITGSGKFYPGTVFTHQQFVFNVLGAAAVTSIYISTEHRHFYER